MAADWAAAIVISAAFVLAVGAPVLAGAALAHRRVPALRPFLDPMNAIIFLAQVADGATTWIGIENPFHLDLPRFRETVFVSGLVIEHFGGGTYFVLKVLLGIFVVLALGAASEHAVSQRERGLLRLVQLTLVVIGLIPVWNNVGNLLALGR